MYEGEHWKDAVRGGNRWSEITRSVIELREALDRCDLQQAGHLLRRILTMSHNTGHVEEKLRRRDAGLTLEKTT